MVSRREKEVERAIEVLFMAARRAGALGGALICFELAESSKRVAR